MCGWAEDWHRTAAKVFSRTSQSYPCVWSIDSGINYAGNIGQRMTDPSIRSNTGSTLLWMDDKASYLSLCEDWGYLSIKSMDNTSLIHLCMATLATGDHPHSTRKGLIIQGRIWDSPGQTLLYSCLPTEASTVEHPGWSIEILAHMQYGFLVGHEIRDPLRVLCSQNCHHSEEELNPHQSVRCWGSS